MRAMTRFQPGSKPRRVPLAGITLDATPTARLPLTKRSMASFTRWRECSTDGRAWVERETSPDEAAGLRRLHENLQALGEPQGWFSGETLALRAGIAERLLAGLEAQDGTLPDLVRACRLERRGCQVYWPTAMENALKRLLEPGWEAARKAQRAQMRERERRETERLRFAVVAVLAAILEKRKETRVETATAAALVREVEADRFTPEERESGRRALEAAAPPHDDPTHEHGAWREGEVREMLAAIEDEQAAREGHLAERLAETENELRSAHAKIAGLLSTVERAERERDALQVRLDTARLQISEDGDRHRVEMENADSEARELREALRRERERVELLRSDLEQAEGNYRRALEMGVNEEEQADRAIETLKAALRGALSSSRTPSTVVEWATEAAMQIRGLQTALDSPEVVVRTPAEAPIRREVTPEDCRYWETAEAELIEAADDLVEDALLHGLRNMRPNALRRLAVAVDAFTDALEAAPQGCESDEVAA